MEIDNHNVSNVLLSEAIEFLHNSADKVLFKVSRNSSDVPRNSEFFSMFYINTRICLLQKEDKSHTLTQFIKCLKPCKVKISQIKFFLFFHKICKNESCYPLFAKYCSQVT